VLADLYSSGERGFCRQADEFSIFQNLFYEYLQQQVLSTIKLQLAARIDAQRSMRVVLCIVYRVMLGSGALAVLPSTISAAVVRADLTSFNNPHPETHDMARKSRIHFSGATYHVVLGGHEKQPVFKSVGDRRFWESLVADGVSRFGYKVHSYSWAKDHAQMAIQVGDVPLSKIMQNLTFRYTRQFNASHGRSGPLFHGRYRATLVDPDEYLNDLVRYIHNSPVMSGQSKSAEASKWTSHAGYLDSQKAPEWLTTSTVLNTFAKTDKVARRKFAKFVEDGRKSGERQELVDGIERGRILGDDRFVRNAMKPAKPVAKPVTLNQLVKRICKEEGVKEAELTTESRARAESQIRQTITYLAIELNIASLSDMAARFNRDLTTMSRNQRYYREKLAEDKELQKHVRNLKRVILGS